MLGEAAMLLRGRFVDQVIGGDGRVILQFTGQVAPERGRL